MRPERDRRLNRTALHEVAAVGDHVTEGEAAAFAVALLEAAATPEVRDDILQSTALGWACRCGGAGVARALLDCGADPAESDAEAWARPRAWVEEMRRSAVLAVLEEYGG
jgi:hypothetical protein